MKFFLIVLELYGIRKHMFKGFIVKQLLEHIITIMVTSGKKILSAL